MIVRLVSADEPCPHCLAPLRLVPALQERRIRCRGCNSLLAVSVRPWRLSLISEENADPSAADHEPVRNALRGVPEGGDGLSCLPGTATEGAPRNATEGVPYSRARLARLASFMPYRKSRKSSDAVAEAIAAEPEITKPPAPAPEAAPASEAVSEPPRKPSISVPTAAAIPFSRHAMDEPQGNPRAMGIGLVAAALIALAAGAWWLFSGPRAHPEARYLPADCQRFISIRWSLLGRTAVNPTESEAPGLIPIQRCRTFLKNAAIEPAEVERINVGVAADGEGTLLVYRLTRPVRAEAILESGPFHDPQKRSHPPETVGGVVVYPLGRTALAFPDARTIVNGETDLLKKTLARNGGFAEPLNRLLATLDFSAPVVIASVGVGEPMQSLLEKAGVRSEAISGTTDCFQPGPTVPLLCVLHLRNPRSADSVAGALNRALLEIAQNPKTAEPVRRLLAGSRVSAAGGKVQVQLTAQGDLASAQPLALLKPLFY